MHLQYKSFKQKRPLITQVLLSWDYQHLHIFLIVCKKKKHHFFILDLISYVYFYWYATSSTTTMADTEMLGCKSMSYSNTSQTDIFVFIWSFMCSSVYSGCYLRSNYKPQTGESIFIQWSLLFWALNMSKNHIERLCSLLGTAHLPIALGIRHSENIMM